jgi:type IV secretory pathway component VirB8
MGRMMRMFRRKKSEPTEREEENALAAPRRLGETAHPSNTRDILLWVMTVSNGGLVLLAAAWGLAFMERDREVPTKVVFVEVKTDAARTFRVLESADESIALRDALSEEQARQFLEAVNETLRDDITMNQRWDPNGPMAARMTPQLYTRLKTDLDQAKIKYGNLAYEQRVRSLKLLRTGPRTITATIETAITDNRGLEVKRDTWTAVIEYGFRTSQTLFQQQANPTAWYVSSYTLSSPRS